MGDPVMLIYNAGSGAWGDVESITLDDFEAAWRVSAYGAFAASREVIPAMKAVGSGTIIFIGRDRVAPRRAEDGRVRSGQGGAKKPRRVHGPQPVATRDSCGFDRDRCGGGLARNAAEHAGQARELFSEARRHGREVTCAATTLSVDIRGRSKAPQRELVKLAC